jgi:hypothetical protein
MGDVAFQANTRCFYVLKIRAAEGAKRSVDKYTGSQLSFTCARHAKVWSQWPMSTYRGGDELMNNWGHVSRSYKN